MNADGISRRLGAGIPTIFQKNCHGDDEREKKSLDLVRAYPRSVDCDK